MSKQIRETEKERNIMKEWIFEEIKQHIPGVMQDESIKVSDDWWRFKRRLEMLNAKMAKIYHVSSVLVFDESMSAFIPRYQLKTTPSNKKTTQSLFSRLAITQSKHVRMSPSKVLHVK